MINKPIGCLLTDFDLKLLVQMEYVKLLIGLHKSDVLIYSGIMMMLNICK